MRNNMRVEIEIPKEFECDFNKDRFKETFYRLSVDAHLMAGNYEKETLKMLLKAFENANVWADED
jgi:hypothetical protein